MEEYKDNIEEKEIESSENEIYKCPGCGANLHYDSKIQGLHCEYCGYEKLIEGNETEEEHVLDLDYKPALWDGEVKKLECKNCGAVVMIDKLEITKECPFCNTGMVISMDEIIGFKPDRVIPFIITKETAIANYRSWLKKRIMAPRSIKKNIPNPNISSLYSPSWTFDSFFTCTYSGRLGKTYTKTVGSGKNQRVVTEVRYFNISGVYQNEFDDVLVYSGKKITSEEVDKLQPFSTNESYVFDNRYIVGHSAEHYSLDLKDGWTRGKEKMIEFAKSAILSRYSYDVVSYLNVNPSYDKITYKYVLLPIWTCNYKFNSKQYNFLVNGETGKVVGKAPISAVKVIALSIVILALICIAVYLMLKYEVI